MNAEDLLLTSVNDTLDIVNNDWYSELTKRTLPFFAEQLEQAVRPSDQPGSLFTISLDDGGKKDLSGMALFLAGRVATFWMVGTLRTKYYAKAITTSSGDDIQVVGTRSKTWRQPEHLTLQIGNGGMRFDLPNVGGMPRALEAARQHISAQR